ncbi:ATP-binding protein [Streptomyces longisporus]|uniref:Histidine kinase/HSP90-like ATPase domain-containing protein n=1 Tax=Streptomyces longisporus TaxID=1948 RepID=A0ABN3MHB6_STRLO
MIYVSGRVGREPWQHAFVAQPSEVAQLRRMLRIRLILWGLSDHVDAAQICVSELVTNVIRHVGEGTPTTLRMTLSESCLRLEVEDPDARALPTLLAAGTALESGRGMALVDAVTDHRWGVILRSNSKVVWCELAAGASVTGGRANGPRVTRAEAILDLYGSWPLPQGRAVVEGGSLLSTAAGEEAAIGVMADVLHWLSAHGYDPDDVLDRAQTHFEAELGESV